MQTLEQYLKENYNDSSLPNLIKRYQSYCQGKSKQAKYQDIINYLSHLRQNNTHPKTLKNHLYAIKIYYNYLQTTNQREDHPCQKLYLKDKINNTIALEQLYSPAHLEQLLNNYQNHNKQAALRNQVIISLLIYQGLLVSEITQLKNQDINLQTATIFINKGKGGKTNARTLPLQANQILLFYNYLQQKKQSDYFITSKNRNKLTPHLIINLINKNQPKTERIQPLKIRQSVIANMLKQNNNLRTVQVFIGHRQSTSTKKYTQTAFEELQKQVNNFHPIQ